MPPLARFKRFDTRDYFRRGAEPLTPLRARINQLAPDEGLIVIAPFLPSPLIEMLRGEGFAAKLERGQGTDWIVYFWRETV